MPPLMWFNFYCKVTGQPIISVNAHDIEQAENMLKRLGSDISRMKRPRNRQTKIKDLGCHAPTSTLQLIHGDASDE